VACGIFVDGRAPLHEPRRLPHEIDEQQRDRRVHEQVADRVEQVVAREVGQHQRPAIGHMDQRRERAVGARLTAAIRAIGVAGRVRGRDDQERLFLDEGDGIVAERAASVMVRWSRLGVRNTEPYASHMPRADCYTPMRRRGCAVENPNTRAAAVPSHCSESTHSRDACNDCARRTAARIAPVCLSARFGTHVA
jgi:hypothetical protein